MAGHRLIASAAILLCLSGAAPAIAQPPPLPLPPTKDDRPPVPRDGVVPARPRSTASVAVVTQPDWLQRPTVRDLEDYYPPEARAQNLSGVVRVSCRITADGFLENCRVVSEEPAGAGFGAAALKLIPLFRIKPTTRDGEPVVGASVTVPIRFGISPDVVNTTPVRPLPVPPVRR